MLKTPKLMPRAGFEAAKQTKKQPRPVRVPLDIQREAEKAHADAVTAEGFGSSSVALVPPLEWWVNVIMARERTDRQTARELARSNQRREARRLARGSR